MRKIPLVASLFIFFKIQAAQAICPVCTVAVCAALGLSEWLGIDDAVSGIWIGGLTVSMIIWTLNWLKRKNWRFRLDAWLITIAYFALIYFSLCWRNFLFLPGNKLWGADKLLLGISAGSLVFAGAVYLYEYLKKKNNGRAHFPYEKVALPVGALLALSGIFYLFTR